MDAKRNGLFFPGSISLDGYPDLGISSDEVKIANMDSLAKWPGVALWDVEEGQRGFYDRMDDSFYGTRSSIEVSPNYITNPLGGSSYLSSSLSSAFHCGGLSLTTSITIGLVCTEGVSFGSFSAQDPGVEPRPWYMVSGASGSEGALQVQWGNLTTGAYSGPELDPNALNYLILEVDLNTDTIRVNVNGVKHTMLQYNGLSEVSVLPEIAFGAVRAAGSSGVVRANTVMDECLAFTSILSDSEYATLEAHLSAKAGLS